ncbi:MAG: N-acetyltransferase [Phycisphaerales bacterium]|nr:N-acetyltransferase [Phycisphaerales bacterium]
MMSIRTEAPEDRDAIHRLLVECFPTDGEANLVDRLRADGDLVISLVALVDHQIVGHVACSPVTTARGATGLGLAPIAVATTHRRQGIAAHLVESAHDLAHAMGHAWIVVLGDPAYYARFGYAPASTHGLVDAYGGGDAFQVLALCDGAVPTGDGLVEYARAFASLG